MNLARDTTVSLDNSIQGISGMHTRNQQAISSYVNHIIPVRMNYYI